MYTYFSKKLNFLNSQSAKFSENFTDQDNVNLTNHLII